MLPHQVLPYVEGQFGETVAGGVAMVQSFNTLVLVLGGT
jgi:hypothetical protein